MNQNQLERFKELDKTEWYHPIDFGDGIKCTKIVHAEEELLGLARWDFIKKYIDVKNKKVLDIGCANGLYTIQSMKDGASYALGLDVSSLMIEKANFTKEVFNLANCDFKVSDVSKDILLDYGRFDITFCLRILYHLNEKQVDIVLGQLKYMTDIIAIQGCHIGKQYMCSSGDVVNALHKHHFDEISIYNTRTPTGQLYHYFLVIGRTTCKK